MVKLRKGQNWHGHAIECPHPEPRPQTGTSTISLDHSQHANMWTLHTFFFISTLWLFSCHGDVIKWKHFPRYWPFVRGIHRPSVNSPHKGQWLHLYQTRTSGARNVLRHHIPELLNRFPQHLIDKMKTHSMYSVAHHIKLYLIDLYSYDCNEINCYICNKNWPW